MCVSPALTPPYTSERDCAVKIAGLVRLPLKQKPQASMVPCTETLTVPVILSESSGHGVKILSCPVTASGTLSDLQTSISSVLGSQDVVTGLLYRGLSLSSHQLSQPHDSFTSGGSEAPRFQASYLKAISASVRLATGQQLQQLFRYAAVELDLLIHCTQQTVRALQAAKKDMKCVCRPDITVKDAEEQIKAAVRGDSLHKHRLCIEQGAAPLRTG